MLLKERYTVLLVDDSEDDRLFMRRALLKESRLEIVAELCDGEEAIGYLEGRGQFQDRKEHPLPDAILLDLKMPKRTGHEVLQWMRAQSFERMFVAVVSGSFLAEDIDKCTTCGARAYFKKSPMKTEQDAMVRELIQQLDRLEGEAAT